MVEANSIPLLVGSGRLARHLGFYLKTSYVPFLSWSRKSSAPFDRILKDAQVVLLAISDDALVPFYDQHLKDFPGKVIHFSATCSDPRMKSCHPLMSFTQELLPESMYQQITFAESEPGLFQQIFPHWTNPAFYLRPEDRALYHACAVLLAAGTQSLWLQTQEKMQKLGVSQFALNTYLNRIALQFMNQQAQAMTGPWVRGDRKTIESNLEALKGSPLHEIYLNLMKGHYEYP